MTHWYYPDGTTADVTSVWGYSYYCCWSPAGTPWTWENPPRATVPGGPQRAAILNGQAWTASNLRDRPYYNVMWTDITRSQAGILNAAGGSNHITGTESPTAYLPPGTGGCNVGYLDGSVEWIPQNRMQERWYSLGGTTYYRGYW